MASGSDSRSHDPNAETKNDLPPPLPPPPPPPPPSSPPPPTPPPPSSPPPPTPPPPSSPPPPTPPPPSSPPPPPPPPPFQLPSTYPIIRGVMTELQDEGFIMKVIIGTKLYEGRMGKNTNQPLKNILNPHPLPHIPQKYPYITAILNGKFANGFFARALFHSAVYVGQLFLAPGQEVFNQVEATPNDQNPSGKKRKRAAKKKDPNCPKRVRNGYNYFFAKQQVLLRPKHPETDRREVSRMIGAMWTNMSEADKEMYKEQGRQDKVRYLREMEEYKKRLRENQVLNDAGPSTQSASGSGYATESPLAQGIHIAGPSTQPASGSRSATAEGTLAEVKGGHAGSDLEAGPSSKAPVGESMWLTGSSSNN